MVSGVVAQKLQALDRALAELHSVGRLTANDLANDWRLQRAVERAALILVDVAVEVCQHVAGAAGKTRLPSSGDAIVRCVRLGALSDQPNYVRMVRLASFPVYRYEAIPAELLVELANEQLDDFARFRNEIAAYFESH